MFDKLVFRQLFDAASSTYTYVLGDPVSRQAVIIDTVFERHLRDRALLAELGLTLVAALDTHCHADHRGRRPAARPWRSDRLRRSLPRGARHPRPYRWLPDPGAR